MIAFWSRLGTVWCRLAHPAPLWPHHGHYQCPKCSRLFSVPWEAGTQPSIYGGAIASCKSRGSR